MAKSRGPGSGRRFVSLSAFEDMGAIKRSLEKSLGRSKIKPDDLVDCGKPTGLSHTRPRSQMDGDNH